MIRMNYVSLRSMKTMRLPTPIHVRLLDAREASDADDIVSVGLDDEITNYGLTLPQ